MALEKAVPLDDVPPGKMVAVKLGKAEVLLVNVDGEIFAMDDVCLHMGGPLHEGSLEDHTVTCPWHEGQYDVQTGDANPETDWVEDTRSFRTEVKDGYVWVEL